MLRTTCQEKLAQREKKVVETNERENRNALLIKDLQEWLAETENELASLAQRIHSQPQVDGETWQFQGNSGEWVSFPASWNEFGMFESLVFSPALWYCSLLW